MINKIIVYQSITDGGDGAPSFDYFLSYSKANDAQNKAYEEEYSYAKEVITPIETYEGSNIHKLALNNE